MRTKNKILSVRFEESRGGSPFNTWAVPIQHQGARTIHPRRWPTIKIDLTAPRRCFVTKRLQSEVTRRSDNKRSSACAAIRHLEITSY